MQNYKKLHINDKEFLAYNKFVPELENNKIGVVFFSGYASDMQGGKATSLENFCIKKSIPFVRFDYSGCGFSSGNFLDGSISKWKEDCLRIIDDFTQVDKIILVGSSMGGWLMLLAALERKERISAIIGIASAPDFTEDLMWDVLPEEAQQEILTAGKYNMPTDYCDDPDSNNSPEDNHYVITKLLIEDGRKNLIFNNNEILDINVPVRLIHGTKDEDVPFSYSLKLIDKISSKDVQVILQKDGQHRMSTDEDLNLIFKTLEEVLQNVE